MSKIINGYELNDDFELNSTVFCNVGDEFLTCKVIRQPLFKPYEFDIYILKVIGEERELRMKPNQIYKTKRECVEKAIQNLDRAIKYNEEEIKELKIKIREYKETINKFLEQL